MRKPPELLDEVTRLETLLQYEILDTESEADYDRLTQLASQICGVPISLVSLIDRDRQWFKSKHGLGAAETPRDISFCGHAIAQAGVFIVEDSKLDIRFADNPLAVKDPDVRFYAGVPLIAPNGSAIGTLCVIDHVPRTLSNEQVTALETLSKQVVALLELRKSRNEVAEQLKNLKAACVVVIDQQAQLANVARAQSFAEMAAKIAHELNNPLAIISANCQRINFLAESGTLDLPKFMKSNATIEKTVGRIVDITNSLDMFSNVSASGSNCWIEVDKLISDVAAGFQVELLDYKITLESACAKNLFASCNENEFLTILRALVTNSIDAVKQCEERWIKITANVANGTVELSIENSGPKIPEAHWNSLMHPFFTTKTVGKGVGLGLCSALGLTQSNGGTLLFDRTKNLTTFVLTLPSVEKGSSAAA